MLLLKLISNEISYKELSKKCDQYKKLGIIQWIIAETLGFTTFEEAALAAPNTLGPKVADENMAYFVGVVALRPTPIRPPVVKRHPSLVRPV